MLGGGPSREQLEEAEALFGESFGDILGENSDEEAEGSGDEALADTEKDSKRLQKLRGRFERSTLVESFCTDHDDELRVKDRPERLIDTMAGRVAPDSDERKEEASWISANLAKKIFLSLKAEENEYRDAQFSERANTVQHRPNLWSLDVSSIEDKIKQPVESVLEFFQIEDKEAPFVWSYRKDYLDMSLMTRDHLWYIQEQDEKWEELIEKKRRLLFDWQQIAEAASSEQTVDGPPLQTARAIAMQVSSQEIIVEERLSAYEGAKQELESAQENLQVVKAGGLGRSKAKSWDDDDDEEELDDTSMQERIESAETRLKIAEEDISRHRIQLEQAERELQELRASHLNSSRTVKCSSAVAKSFLNLFPIDRYEAILSSTNEDVEVSDCYAFYSLLLKGCQAEQGEGVAADVVGKKKLRKGLMDKHQAYVKACKAKKLRKFVELFNIPAYRLGDALKLGEAEKVEPPAPPVGDMYDVAAEYITADFPTAQSVVEGARCIIATEIANEPSIRSAIRRIFMETATLCSTPTPTGYETIHPFHELFGVHLLQNKPLQEMLNASGTERHLFARLMAAQKEGLLVVTLHTPSQNTPEGPSLDLNIFLHNVGLMTHFLPTDPHPWDCERMLILREVMEHHILPSLHLEAKRELMRTSKDAIIEESGQCFQRMLSVGPYRPSHVTATDVLKSCPVRPTYCSVVSIYLPTEARDSIFFAHVDRDGLVRAHDLLPGRISKQKKEKIRDFLKVSLPDVVVVNTGAGQASKSTKDMIEKYIVREVQDMVASEKASAREERRGRSYYGYDDEYGDDDEEDQLFNPDVLLVKDDVARIFGSSTRAKKMFPEILPGGASAICLARFVQDPLAEYANMWTSADSVGFFGYESFYLDIHPLKSMVERSKVPLLRALERCLVNAVCDVGVDINMAVAHDHLAGPLAFVAGLGLRKADALRSNIKNVLGAVSSRRQLFERKLMGRVVYTNAAGYLRVCDNAVGDIQLDPFDDTRIHPECYVQNDFAPKICASALGIDHSSEVYIKTVLLLRQHCRRELEKNLEINHAFKHAWLTEGRLLELPDKMEELELGAYAEEVESLGKGKRLLQFEDIKNELRYPWLDRRVPMPDCPDEYDMFTLMTGETDQTIYVGMRLPCTVIELKSRSADIMTGTGIRGFVRIQNCSNHRVDDVADVLQRGTTVVGVVIAVLKAQLRVEVSLREADTCEDESYWFANRNTIDAMKDWWENCRLSPRAKYSSTSLMYASIDSYFPEDDALSRYSAANAAKQELIESMQQTSNSIHQAGEQREGNNHRAVYHPLFHNMSSEQAKSYLTRDPKRQTGDVVIRPSSSSKDSLVVTWMYLPGLFKHIEVKERRKPENQDGIGEELIIRGEDEVFTDLDEIYARYIQPMNDLVTQLVNYRCYKEFHPYTTQNESKEVEASIAVLNMSVEDWLNQEIIAIPNRIPYCICPHENRQPGYFQISWLRNAGHKVHTEYIAIKPEGYRIRDKFFSSPSQLIHWFKQEASKDSSNTNGGRGNSSVPSSKPRVSRFSDVAPGGKQWIQPPQHFPPPPPPPLH